MSIKALPTPDNREWIKAKFDALLAGIDPTTRVDGFALVIITEDRSTVRIATETATPASRLALIGGLGLAKFTLCEHFDK